MSNPRYTHEKRLKWLKETHQYLNKQIDGLEKTGKFDDLYIKDLKKKRLTLKTQIATIEEINKIEEDH